MSQDASPEAPSLPHRRAFVVQLHAESDVARGLVFGRVEHVVSGEAAHFRTLDELVAFMAGVLAARPARAVQ
jgi:hypothetical protein